MPSSNHHFAALITWSALCLAPNAQATDLQFNGFLSAGAGLLDTDKATLIGINDAPTFDSDSIFGLQARARLSDELSLTAQIVTRGRQDYQAEAEWAFASFQLQDNWRLRAGKLRAPFFTLSDYLEVGVTYPWARPPIEMYNALPFVTFDGLDTVYDTQLGPLDVSWQAYYGAYTARTDFFGFDEDARVQNLTGLSGLFSRDWLRFRLGYNRGDLKFTFQNPGIPLTGLLQQLRQAGLHAAADRLDPMDKSGQFWDASIAIDHAGLLATAEWTKLLFDKSIFTDQETWYLTLGYRVHKTLVHVTYATTESQTKSGYTDGVPADQAGQCQFTCFINMAIAGTRRNQDSVTLGLRQNLTESAALKFEIQRIETKDGTNGFFEDIKPDFDGKATLYSVVLDLAF